jgi:UDPglucose 6-dehydrogenase
MRTVSVIGSGYVGVTTAAIAVNAGHKVHLIDINPERIKVLKSGKSFFFEKGIEPLIRKGIDSGMLIPSTSYSPGISESDIIFSCVGTPDNPDGTSNLSYVYAAAKTTSKHMKKQAVYVQKSTVPVGTGKDVLRILEDDSLYVSNPEFLREGTAVMDTLFFDRIVVGGNNKKANQTIIEFYRSIEEKRDTIARIAGLNMAAQPRSDGEYFSMNIESAELTKVTANAFLALKISFANSIAKLADQTDASVTDVMDAVGSDKRIGRAFLNAGRGYGGGCFPKDVSGLIGSASQHGVEMPIMVAATDVNESMPGYIASKAQIALGKLKGKKIAVLGLAFKAGTSDARKSPGVKIANILDHGGATVSAYDPQANEEAREDLRKGIVIYESIAAATDSVDAVVIATDWPELIKIDLSALQKTIKGDLLIDAVNCYNPENVKDCKLKYIGVGRK